MYPVEQPAIGFSTHRFAFSPEPDSGFLAIRQRNQVQRRWRFPEAERDRVFTRFYRLESSRSTSGSGLGLSLVQAIAAQHRATIDLSDNRPGLRVRIQLAAIGSHPGEPRGSPRAASLQGFHYQSV